MSEVATQTGAATAAPALRLTGVTKRFGEVHANSDVDLALMPGEIHALLGENGAGKSTLMGIVFGSVAPDAGTLEMGGEPLAWPSTREAIERGIGMVHQHFMIVPTLTVAENVLLNVMATAEGKGMRIPDVERAIAEIGAEYDLALDPGTVVDDLSVGERLRLEIVKALLQGRLRGGLRVFVLDEPTALLTRQEIERLFAVLRGLAAKGTAIAIITHKLEEVMEVTDRVTVLRDGRVVETLATNTTSPAQLGMLMVGRATLDERPERHAPTGEVVLQVADLVYEEDGRTVLDGVSLEVHAGEIVGVAGVAGNGQDVLAECVSGLRRPTRGAVRLRELDVATTSRRQLVEEELAHVPEDRRVDGVVGEASIASNFILGQQRREEFQRRGWLKRAAIRRHSRRLTQEFGVRSAGVDQAIDALSGGNQQRVILGRELHKAPRFILAAGPTRGIDIAGCEYIQQRLVEQRDAGAAVLLVSLDLDELLALSDRLVVMESGRIVGELRAEAADPETLGLMMGGSRRASGAGTTQEQVA
jgi:simple sugar transport system ATP-binding protein